MPPPPPLALSPTSSSGRSQSRRRRSSPTNTLNSSGSNSALVYPVPDSVAWLEQLTLQIPTPSTSKLKLRETKFELHVSHAPAKVTWSHARTFDEYRDFQQRLKKALRHGHFCHAECPWLFTFVKSYFPKTYVLGALVAPKQALHTRREALERFVLTLQTFLINRNNHCCSVLTSAVADEVLAFINGDVGKAHQCRLAPKASSECAALTEAMAEAKPSLPRRSWDSIAGASDLNESEQKSQSEAPSSSTSGGDDDDDEICRICNCHLADEAHSPTNGGLIAPSSSASSTTAPASSDETGMPQEQMTPVPEPPAAATQLPPRAPPAPTRRGSSKSRGVVSRPHFYTTRLACGHRFHDECIVPKLNESMSCPVCGREEVRSH